VDALRASALPALDLCIISNVLVYCTDEPTADVLSALLTTHGVHAILINERGAEQKMVEMLERRDVVVVRLMDQVNGVRDDRQLLLLPPGSPPPPSPAEQGQQEQPDKAAASDGGGAAASQDARCSSQDVRAASSSQDARSSRGAPPAKRDRSVFPNVPYEEAKFR